MGLFSKKKVSLPPVPTFQEDPTYTRNVGTLESLGNRLTNFDFTGGLAPLEDTINVNPQTIADFNASLQPYYTQQRNRTIAELAANGQLESSTTASRFGQIDTDIANLMQGRVSDLTTQAMQNRINLFGTGLNTINQVAGYGQANQAQRNSFNLDNYQNMVEKTLAEMAPTRGGLSGALTGGLGGAATGAMIGSVIPGIGTAIGAAVGGGLGALSGGLSTQPGYGGSLLNAGAGLLGSRLPSYVPGSAASNNPFSSTSRLVGSLGSGTAYDYYGLRGGLN